MWKDVLFPGLVAIPTGNPNSPIRRVRFTDDDMHNAADTGNRKIAEGWRIPICLEHQETAQPVKLSAADKLAALAKHTVGEVEAFRVDGGKLQFLPSVEDENDRTALNKAKYVSPQVRWNWIDSDGKTWNGLTIQHVAATPIPKQRFQDAFQLSHFDDGVITLPDETLIQLSEAFMKDDDDDDSGDGVTMPVEDDMPAEMPPPPPVVNDIGPLVEALRQVGHNIPGEVSDIAGLIIAIKAGGPLTPDPMQDDEEDDSPTNPDQQQQQLPPNIGPSKTGVPVSLSSAEAVDAAKVFKKRIRKLVKSGRITPLAARGLNADALKVNLSNSGGLDVKLSAYEALPRNSAWSSAARQVDLSHAPGVRVVNPPKEYTAETSPEEALRLFDSL